MTDMWKVGINLKFALAGKIVSSGENFQIYRQEERKINNDFVQDFHKFSISNILIIFPDSNSK